MFLLTERASLLSELTGQTIPVAMRISLLIKTVQPISQILNIMHEGDSFFQQKPFEKSRFHLHLSREDDKSSKKSIKGQIDA